MDKVEHPPASKAEELPRAFYVVWAALILIMAIRSVNHEGFSYGLTIEGALMLLAVAGFFRIKGPTYWFVQFAAGALLAIFLIKVIVQIVTGAR